MSCERFVIVDNHAMSAFIRTVCRTGLACLAWFLASTFAVVAMAAGPDNFRERFPPSSITSNEKADAALAVTSGAKQRAEKDYKAAAHECQKKFAVNDCIEQARTLRHDRLSEIDAVEVEANRFRRRDKADRIEAERAKREADRSANAKTDADVRARNSKNFEDRSAQAKRDSSERARSEAARAGRPTATHRPLVKVPKPGSPEANAEQRAKNATGQADKIRDAAVHRDQLARRHAQKETERARRAKQQAKKETESLAAQKSAGAVPVVPAVPIPRP